MIAYKEMRAIEAEINKRRGEPDRRSEIPLTNFRGIELRDFPAEIARLALVIAEYQCDVLYRGHKLALAEFLPLDKQNWITCGNALRLDWLSICPPTGTGVKLQADDLFSTPLDQAQIDFENEGGETYICGNPQFKGARKQTRKQKEDMAFIFRGHNDFKDCDYVTAWYLKAAEFIRGCDAQFAFVSTSSISEGEQVAHLWSRLYGCPFTDILKARPHMIEALVRGAGLETILSSFVCEGAQHVPDAPVVPTTLDEVLVARLAHIPDEQSVNWLLFNFLAHRCNETVFKRTLAAHPELLARDSWRSHSITSDAKVLTHARAYSYGLLDATPGLDRVRTRNRSPGPVRPVIL